MQPWNIKFSVWGYPESSGDTPKLIFSITMLHHAPFVLSKGEQFIIQVWNYSTLEGHETSITALLGYSDWNFIFSRKKYTSVLEVFVVLSLVEIVTLYHISIIEFHVLVVDEKMLFLVCVKAYGGLWGRYILQCLFLVFKAPPVAM